MSEIMSETTSVKGEDEEEQTARLVVALRIRPLTPEEAVSGELKIAHSLEDKMVVLIEPPDDKVSHVRMRRPQERQYVFDLAFDSETPQESVYIRTTSPLVESVISGYNGTVFAYGATGTGKTYTMVGTDEEPGIMVRALNMLFQRVEQTSEDLNYQVTMSYLEIYNEMIRDLLNPTSGHLELREDGKGMQVVGLTELSTTSTKEVIKLLAKGNLARTVEPTSANRTSSRSHALLQVVVRQHSRIRNTVQEVRCGRLYMIDLAGSERAAQTQNRGKRLVEGAHINRSLLALGNCINALAEGGSKFVNYRDSKLTRLLKDALSGNCRTVMIAHISPIGAHFEESRNTLVYADRAKSIRNTIKRNVMDVSYHVAQYQTIIDELRQEIHRLRTKIIAEPPVKVPKGGISKAENAAILKKLKDQLVETFNEQMEIRNHLMQIDNHVLELSIEFERQSMIVSEWDSERLRKSAALEGKSPKDNKDLENASEKEGSNNDWDVEPTEVRHAWDEMLFIQDEQRRFWDMRQDVERQFRDCRLRAARLEEELPQRINSDEQRELLVLLCKVHELEIEKMEMQAENFLKEHELRRKDMMILRYGRQRNLCDEIINRQRDIIKLISEGQGDHQNVCPPELQDLYEQYRSEMEEILVSNEQQAKSSANSTRSDIFSKPGLYRHLQSGLPKLQEEKDKKPKHNKSIVQQTSYLDRLRLGSSNSRTMSRNGVAGVSLPPIDQRGSTDKNVTASDIKDNLQGINARAAARRRSLRTADLKGLPSKPSSLSILGNQETKKELVNKSKSKINGFGYRSSLTESDGDTQIWKPKPVAPSSIRAKGKSANMATNGSNLASIIPVAIAPSIPPQRIQQMPSSLKNEFLKEIDDTKLALQRQQESFERKFKQITSAPNSPTKTTIHSATLIPKRAST